MKSAVLAIVIIAASWFLPLTMEDVGSPCGALAMRALRIDAEHDPGLRSPLTFGIIKMVGSTIVATAIQKQYPSLPPQVSCTAFYWRLLVDPALAGNLADLHHVQ